MKVLIADDEIGICRLIQCLVDWEALGLEILKIVHNGWEALKVIETEKPDIVITDVCMPEYNGIDIIKRVKNTDSDIKFIVISGYREFEYARDALKYGAEDYLLKPIKKDELTAALLRIIDAENLKRQSVQEQTRLKQYVETTVIKLREEFVKHLLFQTSDAAQLTSTYCSEKLHRNFGKKHFLCIAMKADLPEERFSFEEVKDFFQKKAGVTLENNLKEDQYVCCYGLYEDILLAVINFDEKGEEILNDHLRNVIFELREMIKIPTSLSRISVGRGNVTDSIEGLPGSMHQAYCALMERIIKETDGGIYEYPKKTKQADGLSIVNYSFQKSLFQSLENTDYEGACSLIEGVIDKLKNEDILTGHKVMETFREVYTIIFTGLNTKFSKGEIEEWKEKVNECLHNSCRMEQMSGDLQSLLEQVFIRLKEKQESVSRKPIREAREYIAKHFKEDIDLDQVSCVVGFNPSYFSRLFKKETGKNFVEYLTELRMLEAQQLLSETDKSIAEIAEEVGYTDDKYFSRAFKKYSGLKPKDYRKLYIM